MSRIERGTVSPSVETLAGLLAVLGEELELGARRSPSDHDAAHLADALRRSPAERLELAMSWNRLAGEVALAGAEARDRT